MLELEERIKSALKTLALFYFAVSVQEDGNPNDDVSLTARFSGLLLRKI